MNILPIDDISAWRNAIVDLSTDKSALQKRAEEFGIKAWAERLSQAYDSIR